MFYEVFSVMLFKSTCCLLVQFVEELSACIILIKEVQGFVVMEISELQFSDHLQLLLVVDDKIEELEIVLFIN